MSNAVYPLFKQSMINGDSNASLSGTVKAALVDTGTYTYSSSHQYYTSISSAVIGTPATLSSKTYTNGLFDAADVSYSALTGNSVEAIVLYIDTGTAGTSRLIAYIDSSVTNLPFTPNGGDVTLAWNASGIIQF